MPGRNFTRGRPVLTWQFGVPDLDAAKKQLAGEASCLNLVWAVLDRVGLDYSIWPGRAVLRAGIIAE
jgi:hypothetical protein